MSFKERRKGNASLACILQPLHYNPHYMKLNQPLYGFLVGLVLPALGLFVVYLLLFGHWDFGFFWNALWRDGRLAAKVISLSLLANLIPFALTNRKYYFFAKGIFIVSMLYVVLIIMLRFVW